MRLPATLPALNVERAYARALERLVIPELIRWGKSIASELVRLAPSPITSDADKIKTLTGRAAKGASKAIEKPAARAAKKHLGEAAKHAKKQLGKQVKASKARVDPFRDKPEIKLALAKRVKENVALATSIPRKHFARMERAVKDAIANGTTTNELAEMIRLNYLRANIRESDLGLAVRRARLIARDQVQKALAEETRLEQEELGIERYIWRTVRDERVRPEHVAREGRTFSWDDPPDDGHPGEPINCRCFAEPVVSDEVIAGIEENDEADEDDE